MVPEGWMVTLRKMRKERKHESNKSTGKSRNMRASYLVLWEHFVHFLPSHISNTPQPGQISIAALILTVISGRNRCTHATTRSLA